MDFVRKYIGRILMVLIAVLGGIAGGSSTNWGDQIGIALDKDRAVAAAAVLINETPKTEVVEAVKQEAEKPVAVEGLIVQPAQ